jgi:hypothetical protein
VAEGPWIEQNVRGLETAASLGVEINRCEEWVILKLLEACKQQMN